MSWATPSTDADRPMLRAWGFVTVFGTIAAA